MSDIVRRGRGRPVTVIAPGGVTGEKRAERIQLYGEGVAGTRVSFDYQQSGHFELFAKVRREAERDAGEVLAVAKEHKATRAIGVSRGARAVLGVMADEPERFERVVLLLPPEGRAAGRYYGWLDSLGEKGSKAPMADILVVGQPGAQGHPTRIALEWAERLRAEVEIFPSRGFSTEADRLRRLIVGFLNR
jgi:pimeloyl-ACP methyl ester carboxylesterase